MITTNNNKDVFERIARDYVREDSHWGSDLDLIKDTLDKLLRREPGPRWLDVGCGPGFHITSIGELYPEVRATGIDYSPLMLREAQTRTKKLGLENITLREADITEDFFEGKYHLITFLNNGFGNVYRNGDDPKEVRKRIFRDIFNSLSDGGYIVLSVYNKEKIDANYGSNLTLVPELSNLQRGDLFVEYRPKGNGKVLYYSHWFSEKELCELAKEAGFQLDFLERRMSRLVARFKKGGEKNEG